MIKALIFDLDGTLIDTLDDIMTSMNDTLVHFGLPPQPITVYQDLIGGGSKNMVQSLLASFSSLLSSPSSSLSSANPSPNSSFQGAVVSLGSQTHSVLPSVDTVYGFYLRHYGDNLIKYTQIYDGVLDALTAWQSQGIQFAVVTNKHHQQAKWLVDRLFSTASEACETGSLFSWVQGLGDVFPKKPAPNSTLHALNQLNVTADEALFIGDTVTDQQTAANAGVEFVFVDWGYGNTTDLIQDENKRVLSVSHLNELQYRLEPAKCSRLDAYQDPTNNINRHVSQYSFANNNINKSNPISNNNNSLAKHGMNESVLATEEYE